MILFEIIERKRMPPNATFRKQETTLVKTVYNIAEIS